MSKQPRRRAIRPIARRIIVCSPTPLPVKFSPVADRSEGAPVGARSAKRKLDFDVEVNFEACHEPELDFEFGADDAEAGEPYLIFEADLEFEPVVAAAQAKAKLQLDQLSFADLASMFNLDPNPAPSSLIPKRPIKRRRRASL